MKYTNNTSFYNFLMQRNWTNVRLAKDQIILKPIERKCRWPDWEVNLSPVQLRFMRGWKADKKQIYLFVLFFGVVRHYSYFVCCIDFGTSVQPIEKAQDTQICSISISDFNLCARILNTYTRVCIIKHIDTRSSKFTTWCEIINH